MAYFYSEPSLLHRPTIPNLFDERAECTGEPNQELCPNPLYSQTPGLFRTLCTLSELFYDIMLVNANSSTAWDSDESLSKRAKLYSKFNSWRVSLTESLQVEKNFTVNNCYLQ